MPPVPLTAHQQDTWAAHSRFPELNQVNRFIYDRRRTFGIDTVISEPQPQYLFQAPSTLEIYRR